MEEQQNEQHGEQQDGKQRKRPRGKPFLKGGDPRQAHLGGKAGLDSVLSEAGGALPGGGDVAAEGDESKAVQAAGAEGIQRVHEDYDAAVMAVAGQNKTFDKTPLQKIARRMAEESPVKFMEEVKRISGNRAGQGVAVITSPAAPPPRDMGTERAMELCEKLLREWEER